MESVVILERDNNGDVLVSWRYPNLDVLDEKVISSRSGLEAGVPEQSSFSFSRFRSRYFYSWVIVPGTGRVKAFCVTVVASELFPEKYGALSRLFAKQIQQNPSPTGVLQSFLSALTLGKASAGGVEWEGASFNIKASYLAGSLPQLVQDVGADGAAVLYAAMLTRKRVAVLSSSLAPLLRFVRTCPQLVWHRQCWDVLHPLVGEGPEELQQLRDAGVFVAGFLGAALPAGAPHDVLVRLDERRVSSADDSLQCASFLKDAAAFFAAGAAAEAEAGEQQLLKDLLARTRALVGKIQALAGGAKLSAEALARVELPPHMDRLLLNSASAEGLA